jgi:hypothetical protein
VGQAIGFLRMTDRGQRLLEELLQIRLSHVDHVVSGRGVAERGWSATACDASLVVAQSVLPSMRDANLR